MCFCENAREQWGLKAVARVEVCSLKFHQDVVRREEKRRAEVGGRRAVYTRRWGRQNTKRYRKVRKSSDVVLGAGSREKRGKRDSSTQQLG